MSHRLANTFWGQREVLAAHPDTARTFLPNGRPPRAGELLANAGLARTLQRVAAEGREVFYGGEIGKAIVAACQSLGGLFTERDFAEHRCAGWNEPLVTTYRGVEVFEHPPNSPGLVLLEMLNMLETFDVASMDCNSSDLIHLMVEIKKLAFADREYIADPAWVDVPIEGLLSKEYAARQAARINTERANPEVAKGEPVGAAHTTYFCVVDGEGNAVSHIQSLGGYFGSGLVAGDTGVLLNDRMTQWHLDPNHPNALMGGKRVRHTMNPPMAFKDGKLYMVWGTPGGDTQVQTNMQVLSHIVDFGMTVQEAVEAARWNHDQHGTHPSGYGGEFGDEDRLEIETRYPQDTLDALRAKGHKLTAESDWAAWGLLVGLGAGDHGLPGERHAVGRRRPPGRWLCGELVGTGAGGRRPTPRPPRAVSETADVGYAKSQGSNPYCGARRVGSRPNARQPSSVQTRHEVWNGYNCRTPKH